MGQIAKAITAGRGVRITALVNKMRHMKAGWVEGEYRDLDREEKPCTVQNSFSPEGHG